MVCLHIVAKIVAHGPTQQSPHVQVNIFFYIYNVTRIHKTFPPSFRPGNAQSVLLSYTD